MSPAVQLDVRAERWAVDQADAMVCINMIHISPWEASKGLFAGASRRLPSGAVLVTYGPYRVNGEHTAPSNEAFDASLKARNPTWGIRDIAELEGLAAEHALRLRERVAMPANNFTLVWELT